MIIEWKHNHGHQPDPGVLVAIDPGKKASGYAIFIDRELKACGMAEEAGDLIYHWHAYPDRVCFGRSWPELVVMEYPKIYDRRRWKGDPNDLLPITAAGAHLAGTLHPMRFKIGMPEDWKGQTPKKVQNVRDRGVLSLAELAVVDAVSLAPSKMHNVIDAIGVGLWELKRNAI